MSLVIIYKSMCGIVGYVGKKDTSENLISGLKSLEYRGYDSAGIALISSSGADLVRSVGRVALLEELVKNSKNLNIQNINAGIGHTRWATHGVPNESNAHPHTDCNRNVFVAHNGIIENYKEIKNHLEKRGHTFYSDTDTEVIPHLIEDFISQGDKNSDAFFKAIKTIKGAYALAAVFKDNPDTVYAAKLSSPLVIGIGEEENFLASDASALIGKTNNVIYLNDGEVAEINQEWVNVMNLEKEAIRTKVTKLEADLQKAQKGEYSHFMLKEIFEGPEVIVSTTRGRINFESGTVKLGGLESVKDELKKAKRVHILACGTSYYAGLIGKGMIEELTSVPVEVHLASEFRYGNVPLSEEGSIALAISQSGETADTLAALRKAKESGLLTLGVVNVVGSTIARETDAGVYNHAGPEIGVASTKAFLSQVSVLFLIANFINQIKGGVADKKVFKEFAELPNKINQVLLNSSEIEKIAQKYASFRDFLYIGRKYNYPVALEGALKLKEITYIHAEGYSAGEMKHGPIAMIDSSFPTLAIATENSVSDKVISNIEEIVARGGPIVALANEDGEHIKSLTADVMYVPRTAEILEPLLNVVPLQLFAYYVGVSKGFDVDKPRNLAKSVTVE